MIAYPCYNLFRMVSAGGFVVKNGGYVKKKINKIILCLAAIVLIFFASFIGTSIFAKPNSDVGEYNIEVKNPEVAKHFMMAEKTDDNVIKMKEYMLATNAVKKIPLTKDNAILIAYINYQIGKNAMGIVRFDIAARAFYKSYTTLKLKRIHKNNQLAFLDLLQLIGLAQVSNNAETERNYMEELIKTQKIFEKSNPCEFKNIYNSLANSYTLNNNLRKANYYKVKALNLCKLPTQELESKKQLNDVSKKLRIRK